MSETTGSPNCPRCDSLMRRRVSARGPFWGCSTYPRCKGTRNIDEAAPAATTPAAPAADSIDVPVATTHVTVPARTVSPDADQAAVIGWRRGEAVAAAAAGSGKSFCLVERTADLIAEGCLPEAICILTFNKDAALSLRKRLVDRLGASVAERVRALTYHAYGLALLNKWEDPRLAGGIVGTEGAPRKAAIFAQIVQALELKGEPEDWASIDERVRESGVDPDAEDAEDLIADSRWGSGLQQAGEIVKVMRRYAAGKRERSLVDFSDLICLVAREFAAGSTRAKAAACYAHVMVDEAQDTNLVQQQIARHLGASAQSLLWVGDLRQSIYGFRGAAPTLLTERVAAGATLLPVRTCRRSTAAIVEAGNVVARGRDWHLGGDSLPRTDAAPGARPIARHGGGSEIADEVASAIAAGGSPADFFVLARVNALLPDVECSLVARGLPVRVLGAKGGVWETQVGRLVRSYLGAAEGRADDGLSRVANRPLRYAKGDAVRSAQERASGGYPLAQALRATGDRGCLRFAADLERLARRSFSERCREIADLLVTDVEERAAGLKADPDDDRVETIRALCSAAEQLGSLQAIEEQVEKIRKAPESEPAVTLMTTHRSKGLETKHVFVIGAAEGYFPHKRSEDNEEETRLWYVATTRAAETLTYLVPDAGEPSSFLTAMIAAGAVESKLGDERPEPEGPRGGDKIENGEAGSEPFAQRTSVETLPEMSGLRGVYAIEDPFAGPTPTDAEIGPDAAPADGSKYVPVRLAAFRALLEPLGFHGVPGNGSQYVFVKEIAPEVTVRVSTTISIGEEVSREAGEDSIRVTVIFSRGGKEKAVAAREAWVCRTRNWRDGVLDRVEKVTAAFLGRPRCPVCGAPTRERDGKFGKFHGCVAYPECRGTIQIAPEVSA